VRDRFCRDQPKEGFGRDQFPEEKRKTCQSQTVCCLVGRLGVENSGESNKRAWKERASKSIQKVCQREAMTEKSRQR
jgi:hypothetical protein